MQLTTKKFIGGLVIGFVIGCGVMWFIMATYIINTLI